MRNNKTGRDQDLNQDQHQHEKIIPYKTFLFFALTGSTILFLSLTLMFIIWFTHNPLAERLQMPKPFICSTIVLLITTYIVTLSKNAFKNDDSKQLIISFTASLGLSMLVVGLQFLGCKELFQQGFIINGEMGFSLIYIMIGLHFLHVIGGLLWQFYLNLKAYDAWNDPIKSLLYFSNRFEGSRIDLFNTYWHFVNGLWLFLFLTFLFTL